MSTTSPPRITLVSAVHDDARVARRVRGERRGTDPPLRGPAGRAGRLRLGRRFAGQAAVLGGGASRPRDRDLPARILGRGRHATRGWLWRRHRSSPSPGSATASTRRTSTRVLALRRRRARRVTDLHQPGACSTTRARTGSTYHPLQMFHRDDRVLDIERTPEVIAGDPTSTFFATELLHASDVTFADLWSGAPDPFDLAWRLMLRSRQHQGGSGLGHEVPPATLRGPGRPTRLDARTDRRGPHVQMLRTSYLGTLEEATARLGEPPEWLRHQMVYGLSHFYVTNDARPPIGVPTEQRGAGDVPRGDRVDPRPARRGRHRPAHDEPHPAAGAPGDAARLPSRSAGSSPRC